MDFKILKFVTGICFTFLNVNFLILNLNLKKNTNTVKVTYNDVGYNEMSDINITTKFPTLV